MASTAKQIGRQARYISARHVSSPRTQCLFLQQSRRPFSQTCLRLAEEKNKNNTDDDSAPYFNKAFFNRLDSSDQAAYRTYTTAERKKMEKVEEAIREEMDPSSPASRDLQEQIRYAIADIKEEFPEQRPQREQRSDDFFNLGEKEYLGPDEPFKGDDISSSGHADLELQREIREYARNAAWEMPLLAKLAKPFEPPTYATPLRFRYTTYLGEQHPAANKVVVEFDPYHLFPKRPEEQDKGEEKGKEAEEARKEEDTEEQKQEQEQKLEQEWERILEFRVKLKKLLGPRYNPQTRLARLSCDAHATQAQNKRALGDTIATLIAAAEDTTDTFADIPLDFRHHKSKPRFGFPKEWKLTPARKQELEAARAERLEKQEERKELLVGGLVDGLREIEEARAFANKAAEVPILAAQAKTPSGKGRQAFKI